MPIARRATCTAAAAAAGCLPRVEALARDVAQVDSISIMILQSNSGAGECHYRTSACLFVARDVGVGVWCRVSIIKASSCLV